MSNRNSRDWYSVQMDSLRLGVGAALLLGTVVGGWWGFKYWNEYRIQQNAIEVVTNARSLINQLRNQKDLEQHTGSYQRAKQQLELAEVALGREDYREAGEAGEESFELLQQIFRLITNRGQAGIAWFVSVEGDVQYRRGETGAFVKAHAHDFLYNGDYVRSASSSSAEIYFHYDATNFTLRPDTFFKVSGGGRDKKGSIGYMEYGWVDLDTSQQTSGVTTRFSEITVSQNTRASVALQEGSQESRVRVRRGSAEVRSVKTGETRQLGEDQQVTQVEDTLSTVEALPGAPDLLEPADNISVDIDTNDRVQLRWEDVDTAARYALQVSRSRLFGDTIIDTTRRLGTTATLGLREEGSYVWRVAAINEAGERGEWSEPRRLRVASWRGLALEHDETAPELQVNVIMNGYIAILRGKTEPGANVDLDGRPLPVGANGSFSTSENIDGVGAVTLHFRATDSVGNFTEVRKRVYLPD